MDNKKNVYILILALGLLVVSIAYASLSTNIRISGTASIPNVNWNIHFDNWALDTASTVNGHQNTAVYPTVNELSKSLSPNITKVENLNVTLNQPGDYVKYMFEIVNDGSIDASLDNFDYNLECTSGNNCSHISYSIECKDFERINNLLETHSVLEKNGGKAYCAIEIRYKDQTNSNTPGENQVYTQDASSASLNATWVYKQKVEDEPETQTEP